MMEMMNFPWEASIASTALWAAAYHTVCYFNSKCSAEWNCRIVAACHGIIVSALSMWSALVVGPWPFTDPGGISTPMERFTMIVCLGYFAYDFIWCLYHQTEGPLIIFHHITSLFTLIYGLYLGYSSSEIVVGIVLAEITNPILQFRWFLRESGYKNSVVMIIVEHIFIIMFFIARMIMGTWLMYSVVPHPKPNIWVKIGGSVMWIISCFFFAEIVTFAVKKYKEMYNDWMRDWNLNNLQAKPPEGFEDGEIIKPFTIQ